MKRIAILHALALLTAVAATDGRLSAQARPDTAALRASIERRFDVLPLRDGVALRPRDNSRNIRSVEIANGLIAIDGQPSTGVELRQKLTAADANLILQLSYLSEDERRAMFGLAPTTATPDLARPDAPPPAVPPPPAVAPPPPEPPATPPRPERRNRGQRDGDRVQIGNSITIDEGEVVEGDVVGIGGSVTVDGEVHGDVVAVGGGLTLGPKASVANNVVVVGGALHRDPAAHIGGRVQEVGIGSLGSRLRRSDGFQNFWSSTFGSVFALVGTVARVAIVCLLAALALLLGRIHVDRAGDQAVREPLKSGAIGFLAQLLFLPVLLITIVVLIVTIIGIPLLLLIPFLILGLALIGLVGFTGVAQRIGTRINSQLGWSNDNPYVTTLIGIVVLFLPAVLARLVGLLGVAMMPFSIALAIIGFLVEYVAWTVGFGAMALARYNRPAASPTVLAPVTPAV